MVDQTGSKSDYDAEFVPRIGERISLTFSRGAEPLRERFYRVQDVMYQLDNPVDAQVSILIEEEQDAEAWPA